VENVGILLALVPLFAWALGDFLIQKSARIAGWYKTLFLIGIVGFVGLFPFVWHELPSITPEHYGPLLVLSFIILAYAWALFEALRKGKISIVESVVAIELPFTVSLAIFVGGESFSFVQGMLFVLICVGIGLAVTKEFHHFKRKRSYFEKGVLLAFFGAFLSALTNFYIGSFSQNMSPLLVIWFTHSALAILAGAYIVLKGEWRKFVTESRSHPVMFFAAVVDNVAWIGYALATSIIPISLVATISESYIALAAFLGWFFGHEKLRWHQVAGAVFAFIGVGILSTTL